MRRPSGRTLPTNSAPSISFGNSSRKCISDPQTVAIGVLTISSPGPGSGVGISTISTLPLAGLTQARMGNLRFLIRARLGLHMSTALRMRSRDPSTTQIRPGGRVRLGAAHLQTAEELDELGVHPLGLFLLGPVTAVRYRDDLNVRHRRLHRVHRRECPERVLVAR